MLAGLRRSAEFDSKMTCPVELSIKMTEGDETETSALTGSAVDTHRINAKNSDTKDFFPNIICHTPDARYYL